VAGSTHAADKITGDHGPGLWDCPVVAQAGPDEDVGMTQPVRPPLTVVVAGGGIAGAEALLALRALAGERVTLTLVAPDQDLVLRPLAVAEPFSLGHATHHPLADLVAAAGVDWVADHLAEVDAGSRRIVLRSGERREYDALVVAIGARAVPSIEHATTWWQDGDREAFGGLLRDLEVGDARRVAFVVPEGAVWPLPAYELALMTAGEVSGIGMNDAEIIVVTPEADPLELFGPEASRTVREELAAAGVRLETSATARIERRHSTTLLLEPSGRRVLVDRVVAMPQVTGVAIPGLPADDAGFLPVDAHGRVRGVEHVWAAGDGIAYPVKFGGLATQQADAVAADIASLAGAPVEPEPWRPRLEGVLMTGGRPRPLKAGGEATVTTASSARPLWAPVGKVAGRYLGAFIGEPTVPPPSDAGIRLETVLPDPTGAGALRDTEGRAG